MTELDPTAAAADAIMTLIYHEVIVNNRSTLDQITRLTGITRGDLEGSRMRLARGSYQPINVHRSEYQNTERGPSSNPNASRKTAPRPPGMGTAYKERKKRTSIDGATELWCNGHDGHTAHWSPEEHFLPRADRPHLRHSFCDEGRKTYQRSRRVTVKTLDEISSAGFALRLDEDSNLVGIVCKECGHPFAPGDDVEGDAVMRHVLCEVVS